MRARAPTAALFVVAAWLGCAPLPERIAEPSPSPPPTSTGREAGARIVVDVSGLPVLGVVPAASDLPRELALDFRCDGNGAVVPRVDRALPVIIVAADLVAGAGQIGAPGGCRGPVPFRAATSASVVAVTPLPAPKRSRPAPPLWVVFYEGSVAPSEHADAGGAHAVAAVAATPIVPRFVYAFVRPGRGGSVDHLAFVFPFSPRLLAFGEPQRETVAVTGDFTFVELPIQRGGAASAEATFLFDDASVLARPSSVVAASSARTSLDLAVDVTFGIGDAAPLATVSIARRD